MRLMIAGATGAIGRPGPQRPCAVQQVYPCSVGSGPWPWENELFTQRHVLSKSPLARAHTTATTQPPATDQRPRVLGEWRCVPLAAASGCSKQRVRKLVDTSSQNRGQAPYWLAMLANVVLPSDPELDLS